MVAVARLCVGQLWVGRVVSHFDSTSEAWSLAALGHFITLTRASRDLSHWERRL